MDFVVPANERVKIKENVKRDKSLYLASEVKELWNIKMTVISVWIGARGTVLKGWIRGMEGVEITGWTETIEKIGSARILWSVWETWEDLLSLRLQGKIISYIWCEKLARSNVIMIIIISLPPNVNKQHQPVSKHEKELDILTLAERIYR